MNFNRFQNMNENKFLIIICIFTVIVYILNKKPSIKTNKIKDNFSDTEKLNLVDYIATTKNKLLEEKDNIEQNSHNKVLKNLPEYKFGYKTRDLCNDMTKFNLQMSRLIDVNSSEFDNTQANIEKNFKIIEQNEDKIHNDYVRGFFKDYKEVNDKRTEHLSKLFSDFKDESTDLHEGFKSMEIKNASNLNIFMGNYAVLPYQYSDCNNMTINIIDENVNVSYYPEKTYLLSIKLLDEPVVDYDINIEFKNETLFESMRSSSKINEDIKSNIKGIIIHIVNKRPPIKEDNKFVSILNGIRSILKQLKITEGEKFMLFLVDDNFESNTDCFVDNKYDCEQTNTELFRIYSINGTSLLHLTKQNVIDKPFPPLLGNLKILKDMLK